MPSRRLIAWANEAYVQVFSARYARGWITSCVFYLCIRLDIFRGIEEPGRLRRIGYIASSFCDAVDNVNTERVAGSAGSRGLRSPECTDSVLRFRWITRSQTF